MWIFNGMSKNIRKISSKTYLQNFSFPSFLPSPNFSQKISLFYRTFFFFLWFKFSFPYYLCITAHIILVNIVLFSCSFNCWIEEASSWYFWCEHLNCRNDEFSFLFNKNDVLRKKSRLHHTRSRQFWQHWILVCGIIFFPLLLSHSHFLITLVHIP